jgi:hypothetical protein
LPSRAKPPTPVKSVVLAAIPLPDSAEEDAVETEPVYPVVYGNPKIPDEQFYNGTPYRGRFVNGLYVATNAAEEAAVRKALSGHGPDKPDRWKGRDRKTPWTDKRTGFTAVSDVVKDDFEHYHER